MNVEKGENEGGTRGARAIIFFFLRFLAASIVLYLIYNAADKFVGKYYVRLIVLIVKPLLAKFGYAIIMEKAIAITEEISLNPVVFLSLVLAVGGIAVRTKLKAAAIGVTVLTAANALTIFLAFVSYYRKSEELWTGSEFLSLTINFFLPILLWFVLLPIRSAFPFFKTRE